MNKLLIKKEELLKKLLNLYIFATILLNPFSFFLYIIFINTYISFLFSILVDVL